MESLLIGSFHRPSIPVPAEFSPLKTSSHAIVRVLKCKAWKRPKKHYSSSMKLQRQYITQEHVGGSDLSTIAADKKLKGRFLVHASSEHPLESQPSKSPWDSVNDAVDAFYRFSRPHTIIGTALSIISVSLLAVEKFSDFSPLFFTGVLEAIVAALFMNIYIVGLNQLSDIEIDKVNKPYLPLASGEYSVQTGVIVVSSFAILSFWLGWIVGSWPLFWALFISFVLGTAYSINERFLIGVRKMLLHFQLPLLRWKRFAVVAAMCIFAVRAVIVQIAFYLHIQDIPDIVGDKIFGIQSFTVRLGQERVFWICIGLLEMAYLVAIVVGAASSNTWSKYFTILGHSALALLLWTRAKSVDFSSKAAITSFYMFIWKLFYAEYLLIPLVR
ncbi:homogentisate phytyltransferase 1, chloroplastic isoform X3 [Solanum lycopersicum]|uniref:homogentisate phytyltransferase 1, chloroplastic isoform X3 n=1 Tax=Solanum lycopersicum TaxID=4081 RepID=UPI000E1CAB5E|nr:homogentisate phytyltransferase 1, chloroplastic isoform X4 [Solanum lycopersicum]